MKRIFITVCFLLFESTCAGAQELGDPWTRDEDISGTKVEVSATRLSSGFHDFVYTISAPATNKGRVTSFSIDISCSDVPEWVSFPEPPTNMYFIHASEDGKHAPFQMYHSPAGSTGMSLSVINEAVFGVSMNPGESYTGFRILSPFPSVLRKYELTASWSLGNYDYDSVSDEDMEHVPWKHDFTVTGMTEGPGCNTEPAPPTLFPGHPEEPYNNLLQYSAPLQSAFHTDEDSVTFHIHYSEGMDVGSFKVEPGWARGHFNPAPGTEEVVTLKLHPGMNKFRFEVWKDSESDVEPSRSNRNAYPDKDVDVFSIRRSSPGARDGTPIKGGKKR